MTLFGDTPPQKLETAVKPVWSTYNGPTRCDYCLRNRYNGVPGPIGRARWRQKTGETSLYLCYPHAQPAREQDGQP